MKKHILSLPNHKRNLLRRTMLIITLLSFGAFAAEVTSKNRRVNLISAYDDHRALLIQTEPKHSIEGLSCTGDFWMVLDKDSEGFEEIFPLIVSAQATQQLVDVVVDDSISGAFCKINRITLIR